MSRPQPVQNNYYQQNNININMTRPNDRIPGNCVASSTSQKQLSFVSEPIGDKGVKELPGIGDAYSQRLMAQEIDTASKVVGQYLVLGKQKEPFIGWLKDTSGANTRHANACADGLSDYVNEHM